MRAAEISAPASPTEDEMVGGCSWSVVTVGIVQTVNEDNPSVVDTISDCASGEAGFGEIVVEEGGRKVTSGSTGCPKADGIKVGKSIPMSAKTGNESSLSIDWKSKH